MKLIINEPVSNNIKKESFEVVVEMSIGDGDGSTYLTIGTFLENQDMPLMENLFATLKRMKEAPTLGLLSPEGYNNVEGFLIWFSADILDPELLKAYYPTYPHCVDKFFKEYKLVQEFYARNNIFPEWSMDPMTDCETQKNYAGYEVYYYDDNETKHSVTVEY